MKSPKYTLTKGAEADLEEIYRHSLEMFGLEQTNKFMAELKKAAEFAADNHGKVSTRAHLTGESGLSLYPVNNHFIAYRPVAENHIVIIALFRQSRDIPSFIRAESEKFKKDFLEIERKIKSGSIVIKGIT
jgi:plasmid stabilization system protein ParE